MLSRNSEKLEGKIDTESSKKVDKTLVIENSKKNNKEVIAKTAESMKKQDSSIKIKASNNKIVKSDRVNESTQYHNESTTNNSHKSSSTTSFIRQDASSNVLQASASAVSSEISSSATGVSSTTLTASAEAISAKINASATGASANVGNVSLSGLSAEASGSLHGLQMNVGNVSASGPSANAFADVGPGIQCFNADLSVGGLSAGVTCGTLQLGNVSVGAGLSLVWDPNPLNWFTNLNLGGGGKGWSSGTAGQENRSGEGTRKQLINDGTANGRRNNSPLGDSGCGVGSDSCGNSDIGGSSRWWNGNSGENKNEEPFKSGVHRGGPKEQQPSINVPISLPDTDYALNIDQQIAKMREKALAEESRTISLKQKTTADSFQNIDNNVYENMREVHVIKLAYELLFQEGIDDMEGLVEMAVNKTENSDDVEEETLGDYELCNFCKSHDKPCCLPCLQKVTSKGRKTKQICGNIHGFAS